MDWRIEYSYKFKPTPLTKLVHKAIDRKPGNTTRAYRKETDKMVVDFEPPVPVIFNRGYARVHIMCGTSELIFASIHELAYLIHALETGDFAGKPWLEKLPAAPFIPTQIKNTLKVLRNSHEELKAGAELG